LNQKDHKKVYFFSDCHLGIPNAQSSREREKILVKWLDSIKPDVHELYILGDLFDFWFEYKTTIPKGFVRLLGKLAEFTDNGIPVYFFRGNHDIWAFDYFNEEIGIQMHRKPQIKTILGKRFYLAHGDGLGKGDKGYKFIKWVFERKINQWLFKWLHPDWGLAMGLFFSRRSRYANQVREHKELEQPEKRSIEESRLPVFAKEVLASGEKVDFFVMGHWHIVRDLALTKDSRFIFLGDWISRFSYGVFDGEHFEMKQFDPV